MIDQEKLLKELPSNLRAEVIQHTHGEIIKKIKFFSDKPLDFIWAILPMLRSIKVHLKDVIYNQGDLAEEIFFISNGRVKLYIDIN